MPIYLRQGLVVLSLTSGTFLLRDLPFVVSSWRSGRRRTLHLMPHLLRISSFGLCGRRFFWLGFWCTPERASIVSLLDYKTLLFPVQEFEKYVVNPDAESDFSGSNIDPCPDVSQEGSSKNELYAQVPLHVEDNKVSEDEGVSDPYEHVFDYPLAMSNCGICELHEHTGLGKNRIS